MTTATATLDELQHDFDAVEKAAVRGSVRITRKGRVIGIYTAIKSAKGKNWPPPIFSDAAPSRMNPLTCAITSADENRPFHP